MGGKKFNKTILNNTLNFIINLLNNNNIQNWFIGYGTLLGIIRNNSCIDDDDDVDIIINKDNYDIVKKLLIDNNLQLEYGYGIKKATNILKTKDTDKYCSIDFYMADVDNNGNFNDTWEKVIWSKCYDDTTNNLLEFTWNNTKLYLPFNYENKLFNRYGKDWKIPMNTKGPNPRKPII